MKKAIAAGVLVMGLALTGCSGSQVFQESTGEQKVHLKDGRTVTCVSWKLANAGGFSCDWERAK